MATIKGTAFNQVNMVIKVNLKRLCTVYMQILAKAKTYDVISCIMQWKQRNYIRMRKIMDEILCILGDSSNESEAGEARKTGFNKLMNWI